MRVATLPSVLDAIVAASRRSVAARRALVSDVDLARRARDVDRRPSGHDFVARLEEPGPSFIAECKRRSPSKGILRADYDPAGLARAYVRGGAMAVSVLTEPAFFDGDLAHLAAVREVVELPLLRKDFIVDAYQLDEAVVAGADAVLLIVAALDDATMRDLLEGARQRGLAALVEVHHEHDLERALGAEARVIGVNNRDLHSMQVDLTTSSRLIRHIPDECVAVSESGLSSVDDIARLAGEGFDGFLIGERFVGASDPGEALADVLVATRLALARGRTR